MSLVGLVSPDDLEAGDEVFQSYQKAVSANRVVHIGWHDLLGEGQAQRIDYERDWQCSGVA
jgi:hypothetical protein